MAGNGRMEGGQGVSETRVRMLPEWDNERHLGRESPPGSSGRLWLVRASEARCRKCQTNCRGPGFASFLEKSSEEAKGLIPLHKVVFITCRNG